MTDPSAALKAEVSELQALGQSLAKYAPDFAVNVTDWSRQLQQVWQTGGAPFMLEQKMEWFARALRQRWLSYAAAVPSGVYRSPTEEQQKSMSRNSKLEAFSYERDLHPAKLEQRCVGFFPDLPSPWQAQHLLFSSGQAAMTVALLVLQQRLCPRKITVAHLGKYFETRSLLEALPAAIHLLNPMHAMEAECLIVEPIACDGCFARVDLKELAERMAAHPGKPRAVIIDSTLLGRVDNVNLLLERMPAEAPPIIMRVCSGLKLFQAGLEIANVGILTWFQRQDSNERSAPAGESLRALRTLTGGGLRSADALALEAPWIFDLESTSRYERAIFGHNAALAAAVSKRNHLFEPLSNSTLEGADAPYRVFRLRCPSDQAYCALEEEIAAEVQRHQLNFDKGGSFGFRGHRFEVVRPDTGQEFFLRIAMGRRGGWSCNGIIKMMERLASNHF